MKKETEAKNEPFDDYIPVLEVMQKYKTVGEALAAALCAYSALGTAVGLTSKDLVRGLERVLRTMPRSAPEQLKPFLKSVKKETNHEGN